MRGVVALTLMLCGIVQAATLRVERGDDLAAVLRRAADGDTVELAAGEHRGQAAVITQRRLTLRGAADGTTVLHAAGAHAEGKAIVVVRDGDVRIEHLTFRGARVPDGNGAGIRFERGRLQVLHCGFFDNQNGILTANVADAELRIADSVFADAPAGDRSLPHLLYVGRIASLELANSRFSGGRQGHLVKSRAARNVVRGNRLVDGPGGQASYELEFPNGGLAWVEDNVIGQSADTGNLTLLSFGAEGDGPQGAARRHGLYLSGNTLVNDALLPARFVHVHALATPVEQRYTNNRTVGIGVGAPN